MRPRSDLARFASDTPELVVDLTTVQSNITRVAARGREAGVALRPHVKTHKMPQLAQRQLVAGAVGIQVAKLGEAEVMRAAQISDILVGYPIVGESKLARLAGLAAETNIAVCLDSLVVAEAIESTARRHGVRIRVLVEIDTGLHRTGVEPGERGVELAEAVGRLRHLVFAGFLTHEGHVYSSAHTDEELRALTATACAAIVETAELARSRGIEVEVVSVGSAATFRHAIEQPGVTEVRPGTYVFNDLTQISHGAATEDDVAAIVATTVVSRPRATEVVIDAGSKVLSSDLLIFPEAPRTFGRVAGCPGWIVVRLSEEHGVVSVPEDADLAVGDRLAIIPNHICPVVNLHDAVMVVTEDGQVERWEVAARGKTK